MPELPEVETIKRGLEKKIIGLKIQEIQVNSPKSFIGNPKKVEGKIVLKVWRRAKLLGIDLAGLLSTDCGLPQNSRSRKSVDGRLTLLFHLKMSGQLIWKGESGKGKEGRFIGGHPTPDMIGQMPHKHTRVIFSFSNNSKLYFNDQRRFGWIRIVNSGQVTGDSSLKNLGPEPLVKGFTWAILKNNLLRHKSQPVKVAIMDQTVVSGVGNIYASEACFEAKLDPRTKVKDLTDAQFKKLCAGIVKCLQAGIKYGGSTKTHFVDADGNKGYFLDYAAVYWKNGKPCKICGTEIKKITLGGRGTYLCPRCQKL